MKERATGGETFSRRRGSDLNQKWVGACRGQLLGDKNQTCDLCRENRHSPPPLPSGSCQGSLLATPAAAREQEKLAAVAHTGSLLGQIRGRWVDWGLAKDRDQGQEEGGKPARGTCVKALQHHFQLPQRPTRQTQNAENFPRRNLRFPSSGGSQMKGSIKRYRKPFIKRGPGLTPDSSKARAKNGTEGWGMSGSRSTG